ncbi:hypothetical protein BN873_360080 [Candidatus Competibacter denitrificans Run_A_D11]|uniref:Uncharacterized protein n=1 Tax=Candidatus Competibacter denitrificans Run_A_D11 TaxID=1400863 RepID=W6M537_9GAMM|nr:hypothetical protein BN873_360080 [Candidatus Competibacter denitrificans Run_A_D11]
MEPIDGFGGAAGRGWTGGEPERARRGGTVLSPHRKPLLSLVSGREQRSGVASWVYKRPLKSSSGRSSAMKARAA